MPDAAFLAIIMAIFAGLQVYFNWSRNKREISKDGQEELEKHINGVRDEVTKGQVASNSKYEDLNNRLRKVEHERITETRVQNMLENKVQPLEIGFKKMEGTINKMEHEIRSVSSEIQKSHTETNGHIMQLIEAVSFVKGMLEARGRDDVRRD